MIVFQKLSCLTQGKVTPQSRTINIFHKIFTQICADKLTFYELPMKRWFESDKSNTNYLILFNMLFAIWNYLQIELGPYLPDAIPILASFLRKNHRALKQSTLQCLDVLMSNYADKINTDMVSCCVGLNFSQILLLFMIGVCYWL